MIPLIHACSSCGAEMEIRTYRKFTCCPKCGKKDPFPGFKYRDIDWSGSMYTHVKYIMGCPACRGKNMYLEQNAESGIVRIADIKSRRSRSFSASSGFVMTAKLF